MENIKKNFCSKMLSILAKEKGYNYPSCLFFIYNSDIKWEPANLNYNSCNGGKSHTTVPELFELQRWLREKHNIHIVINIDWIYDDFLDKKLRYRYSLINMTTFEPISNPSTYNKYKKYFISFEDALEDAEFEALQLI